MRYFNSLIRAMAYATVATYALYTVGDMHTKHLAVELADIQAKADQVRYDSEFAVTLGGCATDTECAMAEAAAVKAVAKERSLGSNGGGGRLMAGR
jgi:hypothetical protein